MAAQAMLFLGHTRKHDLSKLMAISNQ